MISVISRVLLGLRQDRFFLALLAGLLIFAIAQPARIASYGSLVDWPTIAALTGLLLLTKGLELSGALHALGLLALLSYQTYGRMPPRTWLEMHELYRLLEASGQLDAEVQDSDGPCSPATAYRRQLLLYRNPRPSRYWAAGESARATLMPTARRRRVACMLCSCASPAWPGGWATV